MQYIKIEKKGDIRILTVNKPDVLNALDKAVLAELDAAVDQIKEDPDVKALIITGAGRAFVAGADIAAQSVLDTRGGRAWGQQGSAIFRKIEILEVPTIAAVNGFALGGGCELALSCDLIIASEKAKFGQPEVTLGITPGFAGTQRLPRRIGAAKAKELIFTGEIIKAHEAEKIGLANKVVLPENLMTAAIEMAEKIIKNAPIAVKYSKVAINRGLDVDLDTGIAIENELFALCFATVDQQEGMSAFLEKKPPKFTNK